MNPFLEHSCPDVHATLITYIRDELSPALPDDLTSRSGMRICVLDETNGVSHYRADIAVIGDPAESWKSGLAPVWSPEITDSSSAVTARVILHVDSPRERWIEIRTDSGTFVTVIDWKLDYQRLLHIPLSDADQEWSAGCITEAGIALPGNP